MVLSMRQCSRGAKELEVARQMSAAGFVLSWDAQQAVHIFADFEAAVPMARAGPCRFRRRALLADFAGQDAAESLACASRSRPERAKAARCRRTVLWQIFPAARATGCR